VEHNLMGCFSFKWMSDEMKPSFYNSLALDDCWQWLKYGYLRYWTLGYMWTLH